ncbi:conserved hypothetical protein [Trichinella spiralis]|uniref:hypothetical protein n=1 Tax=Trichinella spiralis TaxID=6334 RepID=UPI0001EFEAFD|nr:conserved hypothetical protein [Trichinella spiralis]
MDSVEWLERLEDFLCISRVPPLTMAWSLATFLVTQSAVSSTRQDKQERIPLKSSRSDCWTPTARKNGKRGVDSRTTRREKRRLFQLRWFGSLLTRLPTRKTPNPTTADGHTHRPGNRRVLFMAVLQTGETPCVNGKLIWTRVSLLLDTGAVVSVITESLWQITSGGEPLERETGTILLADGRRMCTSGLGVVPLQLGRWRGRVAVMVVRNLVVQGVMGTNFFDSFVRTVDWQTREITMTDGSKVRIEHGPSRAGQPSIGCAVLAKPRSVASDAGAGTDGPEDGTRVLVDGAECSARSRRLLRSILRKCGKAISRSEADLGRMSLVKHRIETGRAQPVKLPPRRLPQAQREVVDRLIREMLHAGVIEPASGLWSSPVVLVRKKDGSSRFCVDYRRLNAVTLVDACCNY